MITTLSGESPDFKLDPDYLEFRDKANLRLIVSVDLRGSTFLKTSPKIKDPWILEIGAFYRQFPMFLAMAYDSLPDYCKADRFKSRLRLELFKLKGDEMLFHVRLERHENAVFHIQALKHAVKAYNRDPNEPSRNVLKAKACAWICGLPVTDFEVKGFFYETDGKKIPFPVDFVGPSMDIGFRIAESAKARKLVVSYDLAFMLIHGLRKSGVSPENREMHFFYDGSESLKGVLGGFPYPIIWINVYDAVPAREEKLKGVHKSYCDLDDLLAFCVEFQKEHEMPRWFISCDADPEFEGPTPEWLEKYKLYKRQLRAKGLDPSAEIGQ